MPTTAMNSMIYLDNAAATRIDSRVLAAMQEHYENTWGNAGALHSEGIAARTVVSEARATIAACIGSRADDLTFTSGGTEANNLAIIGTVERLLDEGKRYEELHLITTTIEHSSVLDCMRRLESRGASITYVPVDAEGFVDKDALVDALRPNTALVSIILAHNEIGTIQDMHALTRLIRTHASSDSTPCIHTDASQAPAWMRCEPNTLGVDLMTLDAQKMYGPKGVGALFHAPQATPAPVLVGGGTAEHPRPGTPPVALLTGFAKALEIVETERSTYVDRIRTIRDTAITSLQNDIPQAHLNGATGTSRLTNNINFSFPGLDGEEIVLRLDAAGIAASTRSACLTSATPGSYVVQALGKGDASAISAVRLSLARTTTEAEMQEAVATLTMVVQRLSTQTP